MKLSAADLADVKPLDGPAPGGPIKLSQADLADVRDAEPAPVAPGGIGLSGPGSKDDQFPAHPPIEAPVPRGPSDIPADIASGAAHSVKSIGRGLATLSGEASPLGPDGARVPFSGLMEGSKRRELERGVSDVVTFGLAEKAANLIPDYAASAAPDAAAAPGYRDAGGVAGMALPNPVGEAVNIAGKVGRDAIGAAGAVAKLGGRKAGDAIEAVGEGSMARSNKRMHNVISEGGTVKQKAALDQVEMADVEMFRNTPALKRAAGNAEKVHAAAEDTLAPIEATQKETLARAQMIAGPAQADSAAAALRDAHAKLAANFDEAEIAQAMEKHIKKAEKWAEEGKSIPLETLRGEKSRLQDIANNKGPNAEPTAAQAAAREAGDVYKKLLEDHVDAALPGEGKAFAQRATDESVLLRIKAIAKQNIGKPRRPNGFFSEMSKQLDKSLTSSLIKAPVIAAKYGFRSADEALAMLARSARSGKRPPAEMIQEAIAAGVKPSSAAAISDAVPIAVDEPGTVPLPNERMADIVPLGTGGEDLAAGQAKRATAPDDYEMLGATKRNVVAR